MLDGRRRPEGRFFIGMLSVLLVWWGALAGTANAADGSAPATTRVSDTLFRADGVPAAGVVLISWPAFTTSDAKPVAEGTKSVTLGNGGSLALASCPAGVVASEVFYYVDQSHLQQCESDGGDGVFLEVRWDRDGGDRDGEWRSLEHDGDGRPWRTEPPHQSWECVV